MNRSAPSLNTIESMILETFPLITLFLLDWLTPTRLDTALKTLRFSASTSRAVFASDLMNLLVSDDFWSSSLTRVSTSASIALPRLNSTSAQAWHPARHTCDLKFLTPFSRDD